MNEDNKIVHNERKIVDSNYPPRSLNNRLRLSGCKIHMRIHLSSYRERSSR